MQNSALTSFLSKTLIFITIFSNFFTKNNIIKDQPDSPSKLKVSDGSSETVNQHFFILKDVGEAYMDNFGLTESDFKSIADAGFTIIEGNFDICASDEDMEYFLKKAQEHGLKVIMPAGSGEAEWGYVCDTEPDQFQKPVWQARLVGDWINKWKSYENIFAWDTSNEAGSVMPNSEKGYYLSAQQLQEAYKTVKVNDPERPVMIRMNGWFFYDYDEDFFREGNPFAKDAADIVMINAYSNVEDYYSDFVETVSTRAQKTISEINPDAKLIISLGTWEEKPLWVKPTYDQLKNDYNSSLKLNPLGIAFFKYGARGSEWFLPDEKTLWQNIIKLINPQG